MHLTTRSTRRRQQGLTLIESMVALLVISIGLLGIAALQLTAMQQNNTALNHSQAVWINYNMADRIRANMGQFANYAGIDTSQTYTQDCTAGPCIPSQIVDSDAREWQAEVQNLPAGLGMITGDATGLTISVMWDDEGTGANGTNCGPDPAVDLTCFTTTMLP